MERSSPNFLGSIVIPSWNGSTILAQSLPHLAKLKGGPWEILVVDHGRLNLDTKNLLKDFPFVRYLGLDEQLGFAGAVNYGVESASCDLVAVMCNDLIVESNWMEAFFEVAEAQKAVPTIWFSKVRREPQPLSPKANMNFWMRVVDTQEVTKKYLAPDGSAFCFRKSLVGLPFLPEYFLYQEDVYLGWLTWLRGGRVERVDSSTALNFDGGTTKRTKFITSFYTERNRWLNYFYFLSGSSLMRAMPSLILDLFLRLLFGQNRLAKGKALGWIFFHAFSILKKRQEIQLKRKVEDKDILPTLSGTYDSDRRFLNEIFRKINSILGLSLGS